ncbi:argininosuccinate lyase [Aquabacter spiritensis]|uniref:Argininosuccinate lyase n=1 Tax=Aquabacter spiritensis TaxID=933073 RepID=A0A4R3LWF8_9HYPH|nr:argininosuccinate lyase [Aquabacter spiritensis]TCT02857.1 hypothetical protein EDC64_11129 [Aquabacter spiritensis]
MAVGVVTAAFVAWAGPVAAAKQNFELVNRTGYDISEVYVSPTKSDDWEEDVLGMDILENGEASNIIFERGVRTCRWDLKVVYDDDDSSAVWTNIDLCAVRQITIRYNRKTDTTSATFK